MNVICPTLLPFHSMDFGETGDSQKVGSGCFLCIHLQLSPCPQYLGCPERLPMTLLQSLFGLVNVQPPLALRTRGTPRAPPPLAPYQYCRCTLLPQEWTPSSWEDGHHQKQVTDTYTVITWDSESTGISISGTIQLPNLLPNPPLIISKQPLVSGGRVSGRAEISFCAHFSKHRSFSAANSANVIISHVPFLFHW